MITIKLGSNETRRKRTLIKRPFFKVALWGSNTIKMSGT
jgi:hypothetical protein